MRRLLGLALGAILLALALSVILGPAQAQAPGETRDGQGVRDLNRLAVYLNGTPSNAISGSVTDGGVLTLTSPWKPVRFQCDNPTRYAIGRTPSAGVAEYVEALDVRLLVLPDADAGIHFAAAGGDGGATCVRWQMR